jgi:serine/threonine-protein kinase
VREYGREPIEHEARIARRLEHPNIVTVRNADWVDGVFILATDLARTNLAEYSRARRSPRVALEVIRQVASGLAYAHGQRLLHRDVKPENILIFPDGRAALADFGVSRFAAGATRTYTEAGTLGYMAPEQAYGKPRFASDVFSLGLIAYELLTGVLPTWPFTWPLDGQKLFERKVSPEVQRVLRRAAQFDPRKRYPDARAFLGALEDALRESMRSAPPRAPRRRTRPRRLESPLRVEAELFRRYLGAALDMRYSCRRCEGPIAEAMGCCPWCGARDNSFRDVTRHPLICPDCERGVRPEWSACPWCYAGRFVSNGRRPPADPRAERRCARRGCPGELRPFMRYCPVCKRKTRRPWTVPQLPERCPRCRWPVSREFWRFCPWCGRREARAGAFVRPRS